MLRNRFCQAPKRGVAGSLKLQQTSRGPVCVCVCVCFLGFVEGPKNRFGSRSEKIEDWEVTKFPGGKGGCCTKIHLVGLLRGFENGGVTY
jgi:hypothetical protein